jgi:hypothetical protein
VKNDACFRPGDLVRLESEILSDDMECTANLWGESTYVGVPIGEWTGQDVGIILDSKEEYLQGSPELVRWTSYRVLVGLVVGWVDSRDVGRVP